MLYKEKPKTYVSQKILLDLLLKVLFHISMYFIVILSSFCIFTCTSWVKNYYKYFLYWKITLKYIHYNTDVSVYHSQIITLK